MTETELDECLCAVCVLRRFMRDAMSLSLRRLAYDTALTLLCMEASYHFSRLTGSNINFDLEPH